MLFLFFSLCYICIFLSPLDYDVKWYYYLNKISICKIFIINYYYMIICIFLGLDRHENYNWWLLVWNLISSCIYRLFSKIVSGPVCYLKGPNSKNKQIFFLNFSDFYPFNIPNILQNAEIKLFLMNTGIVNENSETGIVLKY